MQKVSHTRAVLWRTVLKEARPLVQMLGMLNIPSIIYCQVTGKYLQRKGFQNRNTIPTAFCVKENNQHNIPFAILEVREELAFEFNF